MHTTPRSRRWDGTTTWKNICVFLSAPSVPPHRAISPLRKGQEVEVVGLVPAEECESEMFITVPWEKRTLAVPLAQLEAIQADKATQQALGDWHYWVEQGYEF